MRDIEFFTGEYYHVFDRGADRRRIFIDDDDFRRFHESMYLFNDARYSDTGNVYEKILRLSGHEVLDDEREPFVKIVAFTLLPNHYHLLLQQVSDRGISKFFQKLNKGYSNYFNQKHQRSGTLFQGPFKARHVDKDAYFEHLVSYIHLNILDTGDFDWRGGAVLDWDQALKSMDEYLWSSHRFFQGIQQEFPVVDTQHYSDLFSSPTDYQRSLQEWSQRCVVEEIEEGFI